MNQPTLTCEWCDTSFTRRVYRGPLPRYCQLSCRRAKARSLYTPQIKENPYPARSGTCRDCSTAFDAPGAGTVPLRCPPCEKVESSARKRRWAEANRERAAAAKRRWFEENPDYLKAYRERNIDRMRQIAIGTQGRRRARVAGAEAEFFEKSEIYERDGWICQLCQLPVDPELKFPDPGSPSIDHIIPISKGGAHTRANVHLAHLRCNQIKSAKLPAVAS